MEKATAPRPHRPRLRGDGSRTDRTTAGPAKVLLVHNFYQQPGGEDQVFAAEAALLESRGHEVVCFTAHNDRVKQLGPLQLGATTLWSHSAHRDLRRLLRRERPQVMHVHNTLPLLSPSVYFAARAEGVPVVQTLHNFRLLCPGGLLLRDGEVCEACVGKAFPAAGVVHACYRGSRAATGAVAGMLGVHRILGTWSRRVDAFIALTEISRRKFIEGGLPPERIRVKPNFVAPDPGMGPHRGGYALFVGRLAPEKGICTLLEAWTRLGETVPLKVVGDGPLAPRVAGCTAPGVEWLGRRSREEVLHLMRDARVLVFPSEWYETFGLTMAEAFATGLPVVASRLGAMAEIVADGHTGLHFAPGDADDLVRKIEWAAAHPSELATMGEHARKEFEARYAAGANYRMLMEIYDSAAARTGPES